jgi:hypothetical protein
MAKQSRPIENQERASDSIVSDRARVGEPDRSIPEPRKAPAPTDLPVVTVGQELSNARERKGKRLSDVWLVLKIRPDQLVAIEEGRFDVLPGRVYAIGYVRSYAAHLGLDAMLSRHLTKTSVTRGCSKASSGRSPKARSILSIHLS